MGFVHPCMDCPNMNKESKCNKTCDYWNFYMSQQVRGWRHEKADEPVVEKET